MSKRSHPPGRSDFKKPYTCLKQFWIQAKGRKITEVCFFCGFAVHIPVWYRNLMNIVANNLCINCCYVTSVFQGKVTSSSQFYIAI